MSSTRIGETGSKIEYECGCTMQRASFHDLWQREYICGAHKTTITSPPESVADKVWKLADPAYTPEPLTTAVNGFTINERNCVLAVLAIRQFEVQREKREVRTNYGDGETASLRLKALESEAQALKGAMNKLYLPAPLA